MNTGCFLRCDQLQRDTHRFHHLLLSQHIHLQGQLAAPKNPNIRLNTHKSGQQYLGRHFSTNLQQDDISFNRCERSSRKGGNKRLPSNRSCGFSTSVHTNNDFLLEDLSTNLPLMCTHTSSTNLCIGSNTQSDLDSIYQIYTFSLQIYVSKQ